MKKFEPKAWTDEMSVGVGVIDKDHKKLLGLLNEMGYIINSDVASKRGAIESVLTELIDHTGYHFQREEVLMQACGYPLLENHKQAHKTLSGEAANFLQQFRHNPVSFDVEKFCCFLEEWWVDHIMTMDKEYETWMQGRDDLIEKTNTEFEQGRL